MVSQDEFSICGLQQYRLKVSQRLRVASARRERTAECASVVFLTRPISATL